jgi:transcriptional regulator of acetoin/glycerol metabolism
MSFVIITCVICYYNSHYGWPGNIRELQNTVERLNAFCQTKTVHAFDVAAVLEKWQAHPAKASFHDKEIQKITNALVNANRVQSASAKLLGIDRTTYGVKRIVLVYEFRKK